MSSRDEYPHGVPCWVDIAADDPETAIGFYRELFGWEFNGPGAMPGDPPGSYYVARKDGRDIAGLSSKPAADVDSAWMTYVAVEDADDAVARADEAGATVIAPPFDAEPAGRMAVLADPSGAVFAVWEAGSRQGAQLVNEPGAWAMSLLLAADTGRAASFYETAFGWTAESMEGGPVVLLRRPGYVGGEPHQPVPRDVVAVAAPGPPGEARWLVDFWVSDVDAVAARAAELGGAVLQAPHDIPGFRNAVIADTEGAALSVSQLVTA
jgi:predicted enzyme related to lactoylglutathione lyase